MEDAHPVSSGLSNRNFLIGLVAVTVLLAALPFVIGRLSTPAGSSYLGYQFGTDDQMVYSAWMRQAMEGRLLMDNRFTTDAQPSLTIHLYFFVLGLIAKVTGIPLAATLSRLFFSGWFVVLMSRFVRRLGWPESTTRLALVLMVFGGGVGFLVWHTFGVAIVKEAPSFLTAALGGLLPTDVWQPEGFVFPSMLTNGLFMVSLCLIVLSIQAILDARESWKPVVPGAIAIGLLMNIHSYDVLLIALVMIGFLATAIAQKEVTKDWIIRAAAIVAGVIPAALWFVHVLKSDTVFQARAQTDTPSANFKAVLFGYLLLMILALFGLAGRDEEDPLRKKRRWAGAALAAVLFLGMYAAAFDAKQTYFLDTSGWIVTMIFALAATVLLADDNPAVNVLISWALVGTTAIYFPGLFQRKLAMGLSIPWAILAAFGVELLLRNQTKTIKLAGTAFAVVFLGASSLRWLSRELLLIRANGSNTSMQPTYLDADSTKIMAYLNGLSGRHVVIAPPGIPSVAFANKEQETPGASLTPALPDLNPILTGLTGVYSVAGHWSETPDYGKRRSLLSQIYFGKGSADDRKAEIESTGADYMVLLNPEAIPALKMFDFRPFGDLVVTGSRFSLIHLALSRPSTSHARPGESPEAK